MKTFYSNGKLLITAEYLVLDGAKALAVPTVYGQSIEISNIEQNDIHWKSFDSDKSIWYEAHFLKEDILNKKTDFENPITNTLIEILHYAHKQNPLVLEKIGGLQIKTKLDFPRKWGLGTSSTLINNIAQWFAIDAFELLQQSFGGSGYDIACAQSDAPIIYQLVDGKPEFHVTTFNPSFKEQIYFVYLNQKQNSKTAIANYKHKKTADVNIVKTINELTNTIASTKHFDVFCKAMQSHETILSQILDTPTVQSQYFADFDGTIKSLGAWGGDFVMVVSETDPTPYFQKKGFEVIIQYDDIILQKSKNPKSN